MGDMKTPEIEAFSTPNDFYYERQADAEFLPCKQPISTGFFFFFFLRFLFYEFELIWVLGMRNYNQNTILVGQFE